MPSQFTIQSQHFDAPPLTPALYLVATPIGHLSDMSLRGLETLASADVMACEDTRVTRKLLTRYGINRKLFAYHEHNAQSAGPKLLEALERGESVALVSDAGTPLVSDPGYRLVAQARAAGYRVIPIPGSSAVLTALMAAGLPTDSFTFAGFLPPKSAARQTRLKMFETIPTTTIWFESPRRITACLKDMITVYGETRQASVARELTKTHESIITASLAELLEIYAESPKGEIVIVVGPNEAQDTELDDAAIDALLLEYAETMPTSKAAGAVAKETGLKKTDLYTRLLALKP